MAERKAEVEPSLRLSRILVENAGHKPKPSKLAAIAPGRSSGIRMTVPDALPATFW